MKAERYEEKAVSSMIWKFLERVAAQLVTFAVSIVLARILGPEDYSVVGLAMIFFAIADVIISGGLNSALIQKKDADEKDYSSVFCVSILLSVLIYVVLFFAAPWVAGVYGKPILVSLIRIMALILPINAVRSVWSAKVSATLEFKYFFLSTFVGTVVSAVVGIGMALWGFGVWALVAQQMISALVGTAILVFTTKIQLKFRIYGENIKKLFSYGWKVFVSSLIGRVYTEINPLVIGIKFSTTDLSYYTKGNSLPSQMSSTVNTTFSAVLFPFLTKYQNDKELLLKRTRQFIRYATFLVFPVMLGFFAVADNFVLVLLTDKWAPIIPYIRIFCISMMFDMIHSGNCEAIKAMGRSDIFLKMEIIKKTLYFAVIAIFVWLSESPINLAYSMLVCTGIAIVVNSIPNRFLIGYKFRYQFYDLLPNLVASLLMCGIVMLVGLIPLGHLGLLLLQILVGMISYVLIVAILKNDSFQFYCSVAKKFLRGRKP